MANYTHGSLNPNIFQYLPLKEKVDSEKEKSTWKNFESIILSTFPQVGKFPCIFPLYQHNEQKWCSRLESMASSMTAQQHFAARPTDIIIASFPKCGTTWTKALVFTIVNRHSGLQNCSSALNVLNPHKLVPFLEFDVYSSSEKILDVESVPSPRLLSTHVPHQALPRSIADTNAKIIYVSRDPKDTFVSYWYFLKNIWEKIGVVETSMEELFQSWCTCGFSFGSYIDHVEGYWNNNKNNDNALFLKYEDMMAEPVKNVRRLADFVGQPFTDEEEKEGIVDHIIHLCSFNSLKNMEVNQPGVTQNKSAFKVDNSSFMRKGKVGDFKNHLTLEMVGKIDQMVREKLIGFGI